MRRWLVSAAGLLVVVGAIAVWAVATRSTSTQPPDRAAAPGHDLRARFARFKAAPEPNGDLSKVVWPDYVTQAPAEVKRLYAFVITHGQLMRYMPCYCGCGQNAGHRSNRDCYVQRVNADGTVVLDSMAPT